MKPIIFSLFVFIVSPYTFASDGPNNSGTLTIGSLADDKFEANLQIDRNILSPTVSDITTIIEIRGAGTTCRSIQNAALENPDVLTASLVFDCPEGAAVLDIILTELDRLPANFTLGVRSTIDHFELTKDAPRAKTILKPELAFGLAGLSLFSNHPILEKVHIGRPHAFFYGGLAGIPSGFYFLLLIAAVWLSNFNLKTKWLFSVAALPIATGVTDLIISKQATLSIMPVKVLGLLYLSCTTCTVLCSFKKKNWLKPLSGFFILAGILLLGFEIAVMLRWLEGQETLDKSLVIGSFYLGFSAPIFVLAVFWTLFSKSKQKRRELTSSNQKAPSTLLIVLLFGTLYTLSALLLKLA
jgi:hypothetical protein